MIKNKKMEMQKITITGADGYPLAALEGTPDFPAKGTIIISSATCIKKEFYINFSLFLVKKGYTVVLYDYRGIGESAPDNMKESPIFMHEWGTIDMNAVLDYAVSKHGNWNIIWLGHSIGSQLMGFLQNHHHIRKVIAINAALGYWGYFPYPMKAIIWLLWHVIGPLMIKVYGYGVMKKIGWGENLPRNAILQWREWCLNKNYFGDFLKQRIKSAYFPTFTRPITALYTSDDYIANDVTAPMMMKFFPNAPSKIMKIETSIYTKEKVGHIGIFRKRFERSLWPVLMKSIEG